MDNFITLKKKCVIVFHHKKNSLKNLNLFFLYCGIDPTASCYFPIILENGYIEGENLRFFIVTLLKGPGAKRKKIIGLTAFSFSISYQTDQIEILKGKCLTCHPRSNIRCNYGKNIDFKNGQYVTEIADQEKIYCVTTLINTICIQFQTHLNSIVQQTVEWAEGYMSAFQQVKNETEEEFSKRLETKSFLCYAQLSFTSNSNQLNEIRKIALDSVKDRFLLDKMDHFILNSENKLVLNDVTRQREPINDNLITNEMEGGRMTTHDSTGDGFYSQHHDFNNWVYGSQSSHQLEENNFYDFWPSMSELDRREVETV